MLVSLAFLDANPVADTPGEERDRAEESKDWLDELNNGASVVHVEPCEYTFD